MTTPSLITFVLCAAVVLATAWAGNARAQNCKAGTGAVPGTLAAPDPPCAATPKPKQEPARKKPKEPDAFWSGVHVGGSVGTTTTVRGR